MRLLLTLLLLLSVTPISHAGPPLIGMNLAGIDYYSQEYMLTDVADNLSPLFAQKNGAAWGENDPGSLTLGTDGYPTFIASNDDLGFTQGTCGWPVRSPLGGDRKHNPSVLLGQ